MIKNIIFSMMKPPSTPRTITVTHAATTNTTASAPTYTSPAFVPVVGDLLVVVAWSSSSVLPSPNPTCSSSIGGFTFTHVLTFDADVSTLTVNASLFVSDAQVSNNASQTVTFTDNDAGASGGGIFVTRISGMGATKVGLSAFRTTPTTQTGTSSTTPYGTLSSNALTNNAVLGWVWNRLVPAAMTPPSSWSELADVGYNTPATGAEYAYILNGFTSNTITWGSSTSTNWGTIVAELNCS